MTLPASRLGKPPPAPSLQLLRLLRNCVYDEPALGSAFSRFSASGRDVQDGGHRQRQPSWYNHRCPKSNPGLGFFQKPRRWPAYKYTQPTTALRSGTGSLLPRAHSSITRPLGAAALASLSIEELESFVDDAGELEEPHESNSSRSDLGLWKHYHRSVESERPGLETLPADLLPATLQERVEVPKELSTGCQRDEVAAEGSQVQQTSMTEERTFKIMRHLAKRTGGYRAKSNDGWAQVKTRGRRRVVREVALLEELLLRQDIDIDSVFDAYTKISEPRVSYLSPGTFTDLLQRLRQVQVKSPTSVMQYFSVMDDMIRSGVTPSVRDFTSGILFVGKTAGINPRHGLAKALNMFRRMEQFGTRRADIVTFNTLGDLALRAHKLDIFRTLLKELADRGISQDRYTWLLKIRYWGLRNNSSQIKRTYRDMVASGEIIDTVVLNCVIRQLMVVQDAFTAEKTFDRMKEIDDLKSHEERAKPPEDWSKQSQLANMLQYAAWLFRHNNENLEKLQNATPTSPNTYTYRMIIKHHCVTTGNLHRVMDLLAEMQERGLFITRPIFWMIFNGFAVNTSEKFSPWNISQLDCIFELFIQYVRYSRERKQHHIPQKYDYRCDLNGRTVEKILRAYAQHSDGARVQQIWEMIRPEWNAESATLEHMDSYVAVLESSATALQRGDKRAEALQKYALGKLRGSQWDEDDDTDE